jgi:hypothetical protein
MLTGALVYGGRRPGFFRSDLHAAMLRGVAGSSGPAYTIRLDAEFGSPPKVSPRRHNGTRLFIELEG